MSQIIKTSDELEIYLVSKSRFLRRAADRLGLKENSEYQMFRKVVRGESKNIRMISLLKLRFPEIDTESLWGIKKEDLEKAS